MTNRTFNTITGATDGQRLFAGIRMIPSGEAGIFIGVDRQAVLMIAGSGSQMNEAVANPEIGDWPMDVTYDSQGHRVVLVTLGGEGALYQRPSGNNQWFKIASMNNVDLESLVYWPTDNSFYGIRIYNGAPTAPAALLKYSSAGVLLDEIALPGFAVNLGPGEHMAKLVAAEGKIIALVERPPEQLFGQGDHSRIYVIDPATGQMELTHDQVFPGGHAPHVSITAPTNNASILLGDAVTIKVSAYDIDYNLREVDLLDGSTVLQKWTFESDANQIYQLQSGFKPSSGVHQITARAVDSEGKSNEQTIMLTVGVNEAATFSAPYFKDRNIINISYTQNGATDGGSLFRGSMVAQAGLPSYYYLGRDVQTVFQWNDKSGIYTETSPGGDFSWPRGTAFDSKRNRFYVVTLVGAGTLYAVTPETLQWSTIASMQNVDVDSIVYHAYNDRLYMVENLHGGGTLRVLRYTTAGGAEGSISIPDIPFSIGEDYSTRLISVVNKLALLIEPTPGWNVTTPAESRIYMIDPAANTAKLTYRKQWDTWPPVNPPRVSLKITSPTDGAQFIQGNNIRLSAEVQNGTLTAAGFWADGQKVGQATPSPTANVPQTFSLTWTNPPAGDHAITAIGGTSAGANVYSDIVRIKVLPATNSPIVRFIAPSTNDTFFVGDHVKVQVETFDRDNNLRELIFEGGRSRQILNFDPSPTGTNVYTFDYVPTFAGINSVSALLYDGVGLKSSAILRINVLALPNATRSLPVYYVANADLNVMITVRPGTNVNAWAVEEQPPSGWIVGPVSSPGVYDSAAGKVKWGPFTDNETRTVFYSITPPANSSGAKIFTGVLSVNGVSKVITGDTTITDRLPFHPADAPTQDYRLTVDEVTAYAAAWKKGTTWPRGPAQIPIAYVTRAGLIWKSGESYEFNPSFAPPNCWVPTQARVGIAALTTPSAATRTLPPAFTPGHVTTVSVNVRPVAGVQNYAVEERPPAGWTIGDADGASIVDGALRYGPFYDAQERTFIYHVVPSATGSGEFSGEASFDGSKDAIQGAVTLNPPTTLVENRDGHVYLHFNATPGEQFIMESADSLENATWNYEATIQGTDSAIDLPPIEPSGTQKFYRLRPVAQ